MPTVLVEALVGHEAVWHARLVELGLQIAPEPGADLEELDRLGRLLRAELSEFDVDIVAAAPAGEAPAGSKGIDPVAVAELIVTLSASGGVLATVVGGVCQWLQRRGDSHTITLTIDGDTIALEPASLHERRVLVDAFVERHSR